MARKNRGKKKNKKRLNRIVKRFSEDGKISKKESVKIQKIAKRNNLGSKAIQRSVNTAVRKRNDNGKATSLARKASSNLNLKINNRGKVKSIASNTNTGTTDNNKDKTTKSIPEGASFQKFLRLSAKDGKLSRNDILAAYERFGDKRSLKAFMGRLSKLQDKDPNLKIWKGDNLKDKLEKKGWDWKKNKGNDNDSNPDDSNPDDSGPDWTSDPESLSPKDETTYEVDVDGNIKFPEEVDDIKENAADLYEDRLDRDMPSLVGDYDVKNTQKFKDTLKRIGGNATKLFGENNNRFEGGSVIKQQKPLRFKDGEFKNVNLSNDPYGMKAMHNAYEREKKMDQRMQRKYDNLSKVFNPEKNKTKSFKKTKNKKDKALSKVSEIKARRATAESQLSGIKV